MINAIVYLGIFMGGLLLGLIFFGGLWWTVLRALRSKTPALWFGLSMLVRTGITLGGIYLLTRGHLLNFAFCLPGFMVAKILLIRFTRQHRSEEEKTNAA